MKMKSEKEKQGYGEEIWFIGLYKEKKNEKNRFLTPKKWVINTARTKSYQILQTGIKFFFLAFQYPN